ncbi:MAG: hypothetical protein WCO44_03400 [Bacteroidota bacterium]
MTTEISWTGTLTDIEKINDLTGFIEKLGYMVHRIYFAEEHEKVSMKKFTGEYLGNIALVNSFIKDGNNFGFKIEQLLESKKKYRKILEKKLFETGETFTQQQLTADVEQFFERKFLADRVKLFGVSFKYPTESQQGPQDIDQLSSISFVFLLEAFIGDVPIKITTGSLCEVWDTADMNQSGNKLYGPLDNMILNAGVFVRNYSMEELYDLLIWVGSFYVKDLVVDTLYTWYNESQIPETEWLQRAGYFETIKNKFKDICIYQRSIVNIDFETYKDEKDWYEEQFEKEKSKLKKEYQHL